MKVAVGELSPLTFRVVCVVISGPGLLASPPSPASGWRVPRVIGGRCWCVAVCQRHRLAPVLRVQPRPHGRRPGRHRRLHHAGLGRAVRRLVPAASGSSGRRLVALALGMAGHRLLIGPDLVGLGRSPLGPLLMIGAAICWAGGIVVHEGERLADRHHGADRLAAGAGRHPDRARLAGARAASRPVAPHLDRASWPPLYAATVALIFCFAAHNKVVTMLPATAAAISTLAIPVVGLLSSAWLLGEPVGWRELAALALVLGGDGAGPAAATAAGVKAEAFAPHATLPAPRATDITLATNLRRIRVHGRHHDQPARRRRPHAGAGRGDRADRARVRQGLGDAPGRGRAGAGDRDRLDRLPGPRHRAWASAACRAAGSSRSTGRRARARRR